jgi:hypothetical protein
MWNFLCLADPKKGAQALPEKSKYEALYMIRNHIHLDFKSEYMMEENPHELWKNLKQRYEQQKAIVLPGATHELEPFAPTGL